MIVYNMYREGDQLISSVLSYLNLRLTFTVFFHKDGNLHTDQDIARNIYIKCRLFILSNNVVLLSSTIYYKGREWKLDQQIIRKLFFIIHVSQARQVWLLSQGSFDQRIYLWPFQLGLLEGRNIWPFTWEYIIFPSIRVQIPGNISR